MVRGLLILLFAHNTVGWSSRVDAVDACERGYAVVSIEWKDSDVRQAGATLERGIYNNLEDTDGPFGAISNAVEQLLRYRSGAPMGTDLEPNPRLSDVSAKLVCESEWTCVSYVPLNGAEPMHMKEMRSVLLAFTTRLGKPSNWGSNVGCWATILEWPLQYQRADALKFRRYICRENSRRIHLPRVPRGSCDGFVRS